MSILFPTLDDTVYVGGSVGAMATARVFGETYSGPRSAVGSHLTSRQLVLATPHGDVTRNLFIAEGAGLVDLAVSPHLDGETHPDASSVNAERWASELSVPTYAIDDELSLTVTVGVVHVVSEGRWKLFTPRWCRTSAPLGPLTRGHGSG